MHSSIIIFFFI